MLITDQDATAPCTDRVQARRPTFEAKPLLDTAPLITSCLEWLEPRWPSVVQTAH
jgi:hypothetical protein